MGSLKNLSFQSLSPNLPEDLALSFYIQSHKLIFATYQLTNNQGTMKFESTQAECSVPWLNEVLVLFTVALTLCQQLKDKVSERFTVHVVMVLMKISHPFNSIYRFLCFLSIKTSRLPPEQHFHTNNNNVQ